MSFHLTCKHDAKNQSSLLMTVNNLLLWKKWIYFLFIYINSNLVHNYVAFFGFWSFWQRGISHVAHAPREYVYIRPVNPHVGLLFKEAETDIQRMERRQTRSGETLHGDRSVLPGKPHPNRERQTWLRTGFRLVHTRPATSFRGSKLSREIATCDDEHMKHSILKGWLIFRLVKQMWSEWWRTKIMVVRVQ